MWIDCDSLYTYSGPSAAPRSGTVRNALVDASGEYGYESLR